MEGIAVVAEAAEAVNGRSPEERTPTQIYRYSAWLHLGPQAEECAEAETGNCQNRLHFHTWCRLPNELQVRDIREKAKAAKARRARQLRDPQSDSCQILDDELDELLRIGESGRNQLIEELLSKTWFSDYMEAVGDVQEEERDGEKLYATVEEDDKRFKELAALDPEQRPQEEYDELDRHLNEYTAKVESVLRTLQEPRRESMTGMELEQVVEMLREDRITQASMDEFNVTYATWEWYLCSYLTPNGRRRFESYDDMHLAAPEVIEGLKATYNDLERSFGEGVGKDS